MRQFGLGKNSVCTVSFLSPTSTASRRPMGGFLRSGTTSAPAHAPAALRFGARLDLSHALAGEAEDLADVAERELIVLEHAVAQLDDRLLLESERVDGQLHQSLLSQRVEKRQPARVDLRRHVRCEIAQLIPEPLRRFLIRIRVQQENGKLALADGQLLADLPRGAIQNAGDVF